MKHEAAARSKTESVSFVHEKDQQELELLTKNVFISVDGAFNLASVN